MTVLPDKQTCLSLTNKKVKAVNQLVKDMAYNTEPHGQGTDNQVQIQQLYTWTKSGDWEIRNSEILYRQSAPITNSDDEHEVIAVPSLHTGLYTDCTWQWTLPSVHTFAGTYAVLFTCRKYVDSNSNLEHIKLISPMTLRNTSLVTNVIWFI